MSALFLAILELTFVMVSIMLLHSLKRTVGSAAFYLCLGMFLVLGQVITGAGIQIDPGITGFRINIGHAVMLSPYLVALLLVYIIDGTLEAQRVIFGFLIILFGYFYLASITANQLVWDGYVTRDPEAADHIMTFFLRGRRVVAASFTSHAIDLFTLPIIYQIFRNWRIRLFFCVLATLLFAQVIDAFIFQLLITPNFADWWVHLRATYMARAMALIWLSILTTIYLKMCHVEQVEGRRSPFAILFAFFGAYGKAQQLQRNIREWEGRYSIVVQQSSELIFILDRDGRILNANNTAIQTLRRSGDKLVGAPLSHFLQPAESEGPLDWEETWDRLQGKDREKAGASRPPANVVQQAWEVRQAGEDPIYLEAHISSAELDQSPVAIVIARNVTERWHMEKERRSLQEQRMHSQRLEAIGLLAGGIAHDFNNLLHTIQGSLEGLSRQSDALNESQQGLLDNIGNACRRGSALTSQMLGFARRGKYHMRRLEVARVVRQTCVLFEPIASEKLELKVLTAPHPMYIHADETQLQQVLLNILINARDAIDESGRDRGRIVFRAEPAASHTPGWQSRPESARNTERFVSIRIRDNGSGIPDEIRNNIFEPFFTTKQTGKGTGMGLSMAYGCIINHGGWIHAESTPGEGTEFIIFLPAL